MTTAACSRSTTTTHTQKRGGRKLLDRERTLVDRCLLSIVFLRQQQGKQQQQQ